MPTRAVLLTLAISAASCDKGPPSQTAELRVTEIATPARESSRFSRLHRGDNTLRTWIEDSPEGGHSLFFATLSESSFVDRRQIASGDNWFVNWADFPSVASLDEERLAAHWLEKTGEGTFAYGVRIACSQDGGETWGVPFWLHRDMSETEHGFATLVPIEDCFTAVWLDGQLMPEGGSMTLRTTTFDSHGNLGDELVLDDMTCECCATAAGNVDGNIVVAYRDRDATETRDIAIAFQNSHGWNSSSVLHDDGWEMPG